MNQSKLQLALDFGDLDVNIELAKKVRPSIDIIEIGTPLVLRYGMTAVELFRNTFQEKEILADMKIADGGYLEARMAIEAGANYVTGLAIVDDGTISESVRACHELGAQFVADMICVEALEARVGQLEDLGVDMIAVHTGVDQQARGRSPLGDLRRVRAAAKYASVAVAGGVSGDSIESYAALSPNVVIVGSGITNAHSPEVEAVRLKSVMNRA